MMRYEKKGNVVIDHRTDMMWQSEYIGPMNWDDMMFYLASLESGWRLPTIYELFEIVDLSRTNPASQFPKMPSKRFWSSSSYAESLLLAWVICFSNGYVYNGIKTDTYYVRCVRNCNK